MKKAKEILYKHAKSNGCKSDLLKNPFLEQSVLNAINEALTIPAVVGRSEQLFCSMSGKGFCPYESKDGKCTMLDKRVLIHHTVDEMFDKLHKIIVTNYPISETESITNENNIIK